MSHSFEKSVKGATKIKLAAPKSKYVEHILVATHAGEHGIGEVFRALNSRLRDPHWTVRHHNIVVFKALIIIHLMMREGEHDVTLNYVRKHPRTIAISSYSDGASPLQRRPSLSQRWRRRKSTDGKLTFAAAQQHGGNIQRYAQYLLERARAYGEVQVDFVRDGEGRLRKLTVDKGLLREVENVQKQLEALLACRFREDEVDNEIALTAFRLLVMDLLVFFHVVNEGVINVLEHYFEMSKVDAERALGIYKKFTEQTEKCIEFLQTARRLETHTRLSIPNNIKHAPTSLLSALEEYLKDPDFELNRKQYLQQQREKSGKGPAVPSKTGSPAPPPKPSRPPATEAIAPPTTSGPPPSQQPSGPPADLIDFFDSLDKEQTTVFPATPLVQAPVGMVAVGYGQQPDFSQAQQYSTYQTTGAPQQYAMPQPQQLQQDPTAATQLQPQFTGVGFGGYTPSNQSAVSAPPVPSLPQQYQQQQMQQQQMPQQQQQFIQQPQPQLPIQQFASLSVSQPASSLSTGATGHNPFRQSMMPPTASGNSTFSAPGQPTKSTNPFKQSQSPTASTFPAQQSPMYAASYSAAAPAPVLQQPTISPQPTLQRPTTSGGNPFRPQTASAPPMPSMPQQFPQQQQQFVQQQVGMQPMQSLPISTGGSGSTLSVSSAATGTNPFRASQMPKPLAPGGGWEQQQDPLRGLGQMETIPVFPRSTGQPQQQANGQGWA
ncbi:ANTH-domain-containing protein [Ascobolus immersus RN42]|uniref:ANTH-domain-containing protein n=1 Tax=Ascobolus immersus RN42 TaxID=1160509 RepID=A0A3N4IBF9_ASCIM|nr:ANTH-domain-containing protein [Ascobolus immersus RN42]